MGQSSVVEVAGRSPSTAGVPAQRRAGPPANTLIRPRSGIAATPMPEDAMPVRNFTLLALSLVFGVACDKGTPPASTPTPTAPTPNRAPEILVGSVTPAVGIDAVTTFRVPVEVRDPDGDAVTLSVTGCAVGVNTPVELRNGLVDLAFKTDRRCRTSIKFKATDARSASVEQSVAVQHMSLT